MNIKCIIYRVTSKTSGKSYVGQTRKRLATRKRTHFKSSKRDRRNNKFYNAIKKYGFDDFTWEVLYKDIPLEEVDLAEICAIYTHDTFHSGYNSTTGGENGYVVSDETRVKLSKSQKGRKPWNRGVPCSEETKKKISEANTGHISTEETRKKLSIASSGSNNPMYGRTGINSPHFEKPKTEEHRKKISDANKGRTVSQETRMKLSIANKGKKVPQERIERIRLSLIGRVFSNEHKSRIGNKHRGKVLSVKTRDKLSASLGGKMFSVYRDGQLVGQWQNATQCARDLGDVTQQMISKCLHKKGNSKKYIFSFCEEK